jgi:hypothetical protein
LTRRAKQWHKAIIEKSEINATDHLEVTMSFDPDEVQRALRKAWSLSTASQWTADNPAAGQCNVTSLLIHELFGGDLLKTPLPAGDHFYNWIEGRRYDFTASQFDEPIAYMDLLTDRADAEQGAASGQLSELRAAFVTSRMTSTAMDADSPMQDGVWREGALCRTHPINGRRIAGICDSGEWRWVVYINGPLWQETHIAVSFPAGPTVQQARELATRLGPIRDQDETEIASELRSQIGGRP